MRARPGADFEAGERLALLAQNTHNIRSGATAERDQHQFHGRVGGFLSSRVHDDGMARPCLAYVAFVVRPDCLGGDHATCYLRLSVLGSGCIRTRNNSGASCLKRISSSV